MKAFLTEYGVAIITVVCLACLIFVAFTLGNKSQKEATEAVTEFYDSEHEKIDSSDFDKTDHVPNSPADWGVTT